MDSEEIKQRLVEMHGTGGWARLAVEAGLNYWTLQRIAAGKVKPHGRTLERLRAAFLLRDDRQREAA